MMVIGIIQMKWTVRQNTTHNWQTMSPGHRHRKRDTRPIHTENANLTSLTIWIKVSLYRKMAPKICRKYSGGETATSDFHWSEVDNCHGAWSLSIDKSILRWPTENVHELNRFLGIWIQCPTLISALKPIVVYLLIEIYCYLRDFFLLAFYFFPVFTAFVWISPII